MGCEKLGAGARRKGQSEMMEYMLMVVFIVAAIIGIMLFLTWWNIGSWQAEGYRNRQDRMVWVAQHIMADRMFANGDSMLDDAKLTSLKAAGVGCESFGGILGSGWYAKVKSLDMEGEKECDWGEYPDCNYWEICGPGSPRGYLVQKFPVNVYRKAGDSVALAVLEVGVYS